MAKRLDEFPTTSEREGKYPWHEWGDGSAWELIEGEDFTIKITSMRQTAAKAAAKRGATIRTATRRVDGGKQALVVQFLLPRGKGTPSTGTRRGRAARN